MLRQNFVSVHRRRSSCCAGLVLAVALCGRATPAAAGDNVAGNLINFNNDGAWSWYMDERAIIDQSTGTLLVGSNSVSTVLFPTGRGRGQDEVSTYDLSTGARTQFQLSPNNELSLDDHDAPGLAILPNGNYIAMYSNHGNTAMGDYLSRYRIYDNNPADGTYHTWLPEQNFNWQGVTGWNQPPIANNRVSYHNLFYLAADNGGAGRLYDFSRGTQQSANALIFNQETNTWSWGGQLTTSAVGGYSTGYVKYASNGADRIYFMSTETHPRNYNNNLWAGYVSDGKTYDMSGNLIDSNLFDNNFTGGAGAVPDIGQFTSVALAGGNTLANPNANPSANGTGIHRLWTVDLALDNNQNPIGLYVARNDTNATNPGVNTNPIDHRLFYTRWDGTTWHDYQLARMGDRLYRGTDKSEEDYTGNGALVPGDPNAVYISTPYDPRDPSGATKTSAYEIYQGVTSDGGADWNWKAITSNSTVDNLRPIVPAWDSTHTALLWFRGTYTTAQNVDAAVVGLVDKHVDEQVGLVHYVDATTGNTAPATGSGSPFDSIAGGSEGINDNLWHWRTGTGNGGNGVLGSGEAAVDPAGAPPAQTEDAPALKTTLSGMGDGTYDIFAYFWANPGQDWRFQAGFDASSMQLYRVNGAQQADASQFDSAVTLTGLSGSGLYRAYLGRKTISGGSSLDVLIDDWAKVPNTVTGSIRTWYDGLGYALVSLVGDYNHNGIVDAGDYTIWRDTLGQNVYAGSGADGNGNGVIDQGDYDMWTSHFGQSGPGAGSGAAASVPEPATGLLFIVGATALLLGRRNRT